VPDRHDADSEPEPVPREVLPEALSEPVPVPEIPEPPEEVAVR
jgi:hypothetical protein